MKAEETQIAHKQIPPIQIGWHVIQRKNNSTYLPKPRFKHQSFIYNNTLYMTGGVPTHAEAQNFDDPLDIHLFHLTKHHERWEKGKMKCNNKEWELVSGHCGAVRQNTWFMFGGINKDFKTNNNLWRLNISTLQLTKIQGSGNVPSGRQGASLFTLDNNWLLVYGGVNTQLVEIYNNFYLYNIGSKVWCKCEGTYLNQAYCRYDPALCYSNNKIYIFGGMYRNIDNEQTYLNDLYEADVTLPSKTGGSLPLVTIDNIKLKRLFTQLVPQPRAGHSLTRINKEYLLLVGGQNSTTDGKDGIKIQTIRLVPNCWIYSISQNIWHKVKLNPPTFVYSTQFTCTSTENNKLYLFGGLNCYTIALNNLVQLQINYDILDKQKEPDCNSCSIAHNGIQPSSMPATLLQDIAYTIEFPFAAIGLLVDNAFIHGATIINITYLQHQKCKVIKITDNAKLPWTDEQFLQSMSRFSTQPIQVPAGTDKKIKSAIIRQHTKRQFGTNIKLASIRLGTGFIHVSLSQNSELIRVLYFKKEKQRYFMKYYLCEKQSLKVISPQMQVIQKQLQHSYGDFLKEAFLNIQRNVLLILQPRIQDISETNSLAELKVSMKYNDIITGTATNFKYLEEKSYNIADCVDVSLRAYLVSLYLKNQLTKIYLSVKNLEPTLIPTQIYLQRIDKLCRHKHIFEINSVVEFDFKILQMYYMYDLTKRLNYFNNGLLIYHKNRLIMRYKYPLGQILCRKIHKADGNYNFIRMLGFIELPDHIPINAFKTNVLHPIMMEKLFSRLKIIDKMFKKGFEKLATSSDAKRNAPTKLSIAQIRQDYQQNPEFVSENNKPSQPLITVERQNNEQNKQEEEGVIENGRLQ